MGVQIILDILVFCLVGPLLALLFVELLCIFIKVMYRKERPVLQARDTLYNKIDANSFPSVHSARISLLAAVICWYYKNPFIFAIGIALVLGVGYSRIYLKRHYAGDVLFGFLIGITAAVITIYIT